MTKRALLVNWDSYPNVAGGGVYTWVRSLIQSLPDWDFVILNQLSNPNTNGAYNLPPNVSKVIEVPLFGTNRYEEYSKGNESLLPKLRRTTEGKVRNEFMPLYEEFLDSLLADQCDPRKLSGLILAMQQFLVEYDAKKCFEHYLAWEIFLDKVRRDTLYREMQLKEALVNFQVMQRCMQIISVEIPKVDVLHCSLVWMPAMAAIAAKMRDNTPLIVTEHGVAFRELVLYYNMFLHNEPSKIFWTAFTRNLVRTIYAQADVIVPVCHANETWERSLGADPQKISVIYNGIDITKFRPISVVREDNRPTVVAVARTSVFKDIVGLIQAINYVRETMPDVQCLLYGDSTEPEYSTRCVEMVGKLGIEENFKFMGATKKPEEAYNRGDVVAFSSITEGFPFAVIEAMACGKAVVATDVGGVREALEGCGLLVRSRRPRALAEGIQMMLKDGDFRSKCERLALERARSEFSIEKSAKRYRDLYIELASAGTSDADGFRGREVGMVARS